MDILNKLNKLLIVGIVVCLAFAFLTIDPAYARNMTSGFAAGTVITTSDGDVPVEELQPGDRVLGYNFEIHHSVENVVREIKQKTSISYYLIDDKTQLTGTNLVYAVTSIKPKLVRVPQLKPEERLFTTRKRSYKTISSIVQVIEPTNIYQVVLDNSYGNLYADNLLIHVGDEIPAYFKRQFIDCQPGTPYYKQCPNINSASGLLAAIVTILCIPLIGSLAANAIVYVRNLVRFGDRNFTDDSNLIDFTTKINSNFTNRYSLKYLEGNKVWYLIPLKLEISEIEYQHLVETNALVEQTRYLYTQYHQDLVNRNYSAIIRYFPNFARQRKYKQYQKYFSDRFNIIYQPRILEMAIFALDCKPNKAIFKVQINAEIINFVVSQTGYVLTGDSKIKQYSEYWYIVVTSDNQWYIQDTEATLTTKILSGDKRAKREALTDNFIA